MFPNMTLLTGSGPTDVLITVSTLLAIATAYLILWKYKYWQRKNVPYMEPTLFFGNFSEALFLRTPIASLLKRFYDEIKSKNHKFCGLYAFSQHVLFLTDPELMKTILIKDFNSFNFRGPTIFSNNGPLSQNLFNAKGQSWKQQRAKLTPAFTSGKMKYMFQTLVNCSEGIFALVEDHRDLSIDIMEIVTRYTIDCIGSCFFGIECNSLKDPEAEFRRMGELSITRTTARSIIHMLTVGLPNLSKKLKFIVEGQTATDFFVRTIRETVEFREKNGIKRKDLMDLMIQLKNRGKLDDEDATGNDEALDMDQLTGNIFAFFVAGYRTSAVLLTFCMLELAQNVQMQNRLRKEILNVLKANGDNLTYEAINEMKYMDNVLTEALRKHPPVPHTVRQCTKDYTIPGTDVVIEKGTRVIFPILGLHRDPEFYPDPEKFDPDRFSEENKQQRHPFTYMPFGQGPRNCIGVKVAMLMVKVGLVALLKQHQWTLDPKTTLPIDLLIRTLLYFSADTIWLRASKI